MARIWITDGSLIPFDGVHELAAAHRAQFGLRAPYKGLVDASVPVGTATIRSDRPDDVLYPEAEWCIQFPDGSERYLADPDALAPSTPIVLQGLIEGKWLNRLSSGSAWGPATLGNNLLAEGPGVRTTFDAIEQGVVGRVEVLYPVAPDGSQRRTQSTTLEDLRGQNILGLTKDVLRFCRDTGCAIDAVDLGAIGEAAAVVNERRRIREAMRFGLGTLPNPAYFLVRKRRLELMHKVVRAILDEGLGAMPRLPISITTFGPDATIVGQGVLRWDRPGSDEASVAGPAV